MIDVAVVGSLHLDIMVAAPRLPGRDETLIGSAWHYKCGGKGGNQAVAAARYGARTGFGGQTGQDDFGERLRANLVAAGVDIAHVGIDPTQGSGMSVAISEAGGEYGAVVVSGANLTIDAARVARDWAALFAARVLLLQNEVPEAVSLAAAKAAKAQGALIVLNAAPARKMSDAFLALVDVLVVNRVEAAMLSGVDDMAKALAVLHSGTRDVVLTRGGDGLMLMTRDGQRSDIPALPVKLVSSHGAGDCFCGALAARLAAGDAIEAACRFATEAAGRFVSTPQAG
ncbi:MAG: PfkB family carbohydrate kinase [Hyphomicrobiales bacterium]